MLWAAWNLASGQLGWDVLERARPDLDDNLTGHPLHVVEVAALNLVFRGVVSAMDLCAAVVYRFTGQQPPVNRERDVGWWFDGSKRPWEKVPAPLAEWLRELHGSDQWEVVTGLRDALTHRAVRRDVTVHLGSRGGPTIHLEVHGRLHEANDAMRSMLAFGEESFAAFEAALVRACPGGEASLS